MGPGSTSRVGCAATLVLVIAPFFVRAFSDLSDNAVYGVFIAAVVVSGAVAAGAAYRASSQGWARSLRGHGVVASVALAVGGLAYLLSVADEPTAIPIGGFAALVLGACGLAALAITPET